MKMAMSIKTLETLLCWLVAMLFIAYSTMVMYDIHQVITCDLDKGKIITMTPYGERCEDANKKN